MAIFQLKVDKISKQKNSKGASRSNDYIQRENEFEGKDRTTVYTHSGSSSDTAK